MATGDRDPDLVPERGLLDNAAIGAVVTVLLLFVPLSPVLGGAVAGYLHGEHGGLAGAASGLLAVAPLFVILLVIVGDLSLQYSQPFGLGLIWGYRLTVGQVVGSVVLYGVVLGAIGGVVGRDAAGG